jgi:hypothetical protein
MNAMGCMIPLYNDPRWTENVQRIFIREDVRLVKGDGAVDKFDRMWRDDAGELDLHPDLKQRIDDVVEAMKDGQTAPGVWVDSDGSCQQNWVVMACFARWYHAVDEARRARALDALRSGNKEPWFDGNTTDEEMADWPYACGGSDKKTCCPNSVYTDDQYLEHEPDIAPGGSTGLALLVAGASIIGGLFASIKLMEKLK